MSKKKEASKERGRPAIYSEELATKLLDRHWKGETISQICKDPEMPSRSTVYEWIANDKVFYDNYRKAREGNADFGYDEIDELRKKAFDHTYFDAQGNARVDPGAVRAIELQINAIQWRIGRAMPKKYGPKLDEESTPQSGEIPTSSIEGQPKLTEPLK